jgi:hypothetical protein
MTNKHYRLPKSLAHAVIESAKAEAKRVWVDQLDCSVSFSRQKTTKTVDEVLEMALNSPRTLWSFIIRYDLEPSYADIGCATMTNPVDYFLWIETSAEVAEKLAKRFCLEPKS